ncbi:hypothetical protein PHJA_001624400, partial [Phtheirospermum japonicum]
CTSYTCFISNRNGIKPYVNPPTLAKKNDFSENSSYKANKPMFPLKFSSSKILIQSAIGVFALGFIDAGYLIYKYPYYSLKSFPFPRHPHPPPPYLFNLIYCLIRN